METENFQMKKLDLEKAEEPEIKLPTSAGSWKKQEFQKTSISASLTEYTQALIVWITENCRKFLNRWEPPYLPHEKSVYRSRSKS